MTFSRYTTSLTALLITACAIGQTDTLEFACDTTFDRLHYTRCLYTSEHQLIALGNRDKKGRKDGRWCYFTGDIKDRDDGPYKKDVKVGTWWVTDRAFVVYNKRGEIISKGFGCRSCPPF
ncbi:MAG: hypothetical protein ACK46G_00825 [Flavobacteriales bacterium]|jgi:hypothetical protein